jgi:tRNA A37 threonylcarbamoyladenosine dehydratase
VYSDEILPNDPSALSRQPSADSTQPTPNGTMAHITVIFGNMLASLVLKHICQK